MNDREIIAHLERIQKCPTRVCEICNGWILQIVLALKDREKNE